MPPDSQSSVFSTACDEIAELARGYLLEPDCTALAKIQCKIERALIDGDWDALNKWHRVRLRVQRMRVTHSA